MSNMFYADALLKRILIICISSHFYPILFIPFHFQSYRAVIEAANVYQRFLNGEVTAAGKFDACKILVVGAGVAGLAAIGSGANSEYH